MSHSDLSPTGQPTLGQYKLPITHLETSSFIALHANMAPILSNTTLKAEPNTDIWRKPPSHDVFNAPHTLDSSTEFSLPKFQSAHVTFSADWTSKFDQAGILLVINDNIGGEPSWIKAGLEHFNGSPKVSFVGCDRWADWSVYDLHGDPKLVTVELRREGYALWAYEIVRDAAGKEVARYPFRECTWLWHREDYKKVKAAVYCCRPANEEGLGPLEVKFHDFDLEVATA